MNEKSTKELTDDLSKKEGEVNDLRAGFTKLEEKMTVATNQLRMKEDEISCLNEEVEKAKENTSLLEEKLQTKEEELVLSQEHALLLQEQLSQKSGNTGAMDDEEEKKEIDITDDSVSAQQFEKVEMEKIHLQARVDALVKELADIKNDDNFVVKLAQANDLTKQMLPSENELEHINEVDSAASNSELDNDSVSNVSKNIEKNVSSSHHEHQSDNYISLENKLSSYDGKVGNQLVEVEVETESNSLALLASDHHSQPNNVTSGRKVHRETSKRSLEKPSRYDEYLMDELTKRDKAIEQLLVVSERQENDMKILKSAIKRLGKRNSSNRSIESMSVVSKRDAPSRQNSGRVKRVPPATCNWAGYLSNIFGNELLTQSSTRFE